MTNGRTTLGILALLLLTGTPWAFAVAPDLRAYPDHGQIRLQWTSGPPGTTGYRVYRAPIANPGIWYVLDTIGPQEFSYNDTTTQPRRRYYYYVAARSGNQDIASSDVTWSAMVYTGKPLLDWIDVTQPPYSANPAAQTPACDGVDDGDTDALQAALDALVASRGIAGPRVLYLPAGTYDICNTIELEGRFGVQVVGAPVDDPEDPLAQKTVVRWVNTLAGGSEFDPEVMFHSNGNPLTTFRDITWDGGGHDGAASGFLVAFDQTSISGFDTGTSHYDSVFQNARIGLRIGQNHLQDDQITARRCRFLNNAYGVSVEDSNALQEQFWDCKFSDNTRRGITNNFHYPQSAGDFKIFRGRFLRNGQDITLVPTGHYTIRDSWSKGSGLFLHGHGSIATGSPTTVQGCRVDEIDEQKLLDSEVLAADRGRAIAVRNSGPLLLLDNVIDTDADSSAVEPVAAVSYAITDVLAVNNGYVIPPGLAFYAPSVQFDLRRLVTIGDHEIAEAPLTVPEIPLHDDPLQNRPVYTVSDDRTIQEVIDLAIADPLPAVVHFPDASYGVTDPLQIPAGSDLVIAGSGPSTLLQWKGTTEGPMFEIDGHLSAGFTLRDISFVAKAVLPPNQRATAVRVHDLNPPDETAARAQLNHLFLHRPADGKSAVLVDGCDGVSVDIMDTGVSGPQPEVPPPPIPGVNRHSIGVHVKAGPQAQEPKVVWSGTFTFNEWDFDIENNVSGVKFLASSTYMERSVHSMRVRGAQGPADVSFHNGRMAPNDTTATDLFLLDGVSGNFSVLGGTMTDIDVPPEGARIEERDGVGVAVQALANVTYILDEFVHQPGPGNSTFDRVSGKNRMCATSGTGPEDSYPLACTSPPQSDPTSEFCPEPATTRYCARDHVPVLPDPSKVNAALAMLRTPLPGFHDQHDLDGEPDGEYLDPPIQVNFDNLLVEDSLDGIALLGGIPPAAEQLDATANSTSQVTLSWSGAEPDEFNNEDEFLIQRVTGGSQNYVQIGTAGPDVTTFLDASVVAETSYAYRVIPSRARTGLGAASNTASVVTMAKPENLSAIARPHREIDLTWSDLTSYETDFRIERSLASGGPWNEVGTTSANDTTFTDTGLTKGVTYYYRVRARNSSGYSSYSNVVSAKAK